MNKLDPARFWSKVNKSGGPTACWPWTEGKNDNGYGYVNIGRSCVGAHRVAFMLAKGEIPKGLMVRHSCDNPACCNPDHLEPGTQTDNMRDMFARGRAAPRAGERSSRAKLTTEQVRQVHQMREAGDHHKVIAARFSVTPSCISRILSGKRWPHG